MDLDGFKRFMSKVDISNHCWEWRGAKNNDGYGHAWYKDKMYSTHRLSYEHFVDKIPSGMTVDHTCNNPSCVNPRHLQIVSSIENIKLSAKRRTHCRRGHEFTKDNVILVGDGRMCKKCQRENTKNWKLRKKLETSVA